MSAEQSSTIQVEIVMGDKGFTLFPLKDLVFIRVGVKVTASCFP
jgi:hypothetical protein